MASGEGNDTLGAMWRTSLFHKVGSIFLCLAYLCLIAAAVSWLASPSQTLSQALDPAWTLTWSIVLGICGAVCLGCRFTRHHAVEGAFSVFGGAMIWVWSLIVLNLGYFHGQPSVLQAGWALMCLAGLFVGWGLLEAAWVRAENTYTTALLRELTKRVQTRLDETG